MGATSSQQCLPQDQAAEVDVRARNSHSRSFHKHLKIANAKPSTHCTILCVEKHCMHYLVISFNRFHSQPVVPRLLVHGDDTEAACSMCNVDIETTISAYHLCTPPYIPKAA